MQLFSRFCVNAFNFSTIRIDKHYRIIQCIDISTIIRIFLRERIHRYKYTNSWVIVTCSVIIHSCSIIQFFPVKLPCILILSAVIRTLVMLYDHLTKDRKSTRLNSSHVRISYAVFCLKKKTRRYAGRGDSAAVMINASPRFTDGGELGFGAATGSSTQHLHAPGAVCLPELMWSTYAVA